MGAGASVATKDVGKGPRLVAEVDRSKLTSSSASPKGAWDERVSLYDPEPSRNLGIIPFGGI